MSSLPFKLLALDCDGTLVGPDSIVPPDVAAAVARADHAGIRICLATGRNYIETIDIWKQLELTIPHEPIILVGGALVSEATTARTLYHKPILRDLADQFADALADEGYCALALLDRWRHKLDYILTDVGDVETVENRWLSRMPCTVRRVARLADATDAPAPLRISAIVAPEDGDALVARLQSRFADQLTVHAILAPNYGVWIVECFHKDTNKLTALQYVAQAYRIPMSQIVAVGDDVNDLPMIRGAGLGVAMPKGPQHVRDAADHVAGSGLASFIHDLMDGKMNP
jgi:Cof subfamily protein (haloacid dehalogenase superfamily)